MDVRDGLGPETITIRSKPGRYEYYVADYEHLGEFDRRGLAKSQAQVRVYSKNVQSQQVLRIDGTPGGPVWHVMDILVDQDRKSRIVPVTGSPRICPDLGKGALSQERGEAQSNH